MATDYLHTEDVVDAVIAVLRGADGDTHTGGLPATWFAATADEDLEVPLAVLQHGDLADVVTPGEILDLSPAILVRGLGTVLEQRNIGKYVTLEPVRIIHIRRFDDCRTDAGAVLRNQARARCRYAKIISRALFNDPHNRLATIDAEGERTEASITGATIHDCRLAGWDLGYDAGGSQSMREIARWHAVTAAHQAWAIGCEIQVRLRS